MPGRSTADACLLAALLAGKTVAQAARQANIGERTAYKRLRDPDFRQQLNEGQARLVETSLARLTKASTKAAATLSRLLTAKGPSRAIARRCGDSGATAGHAGHGGTGGAGPRSGGASQ